MEQNVKVVHSNFVFQFQTQKQNQIQRRGANLALTTVTRVFGDEILSSLPTLWENMVDPLQGLGKGKFF
jgi:hypothetical protein